MIHCLGETLEQFISLLRMLKILESFRVGEGQNQFHNSENKQPSGPSTPEGFSLMQGYQHHE